MTDDEKLAELDFDDPRQALEHAKAALARDNEGMRLWMLDCGELVAKHRARADAAGKAAASLLSMELYDAGPGDVIGELRFELGTRTRQYDRVCRDMRALTEEVISALSTDQHRMTMRGGLPFCECGLSLEGGDASGAFITHILAIWRNTLLALTERYERALAIPEPIASFAAGQDDGYRQACLDVMRDLGAIRGDHPDYRQEWKP